MPDASRSYLIKVAGLTLIAMLITACGLFSSLMATETPVPTETPTPTETPLPTATATATRRPTNTPRPRLPTRTPTEDPSRCRHWTEITVSDAGDSLCVWGEIHGAWWDSNQGAFFITFSGEANSFYVVSYGWYFEVDAGDCVEAHGRIDSIGNSPVMVVEAYNDLYYCH
ncbi:MAG TPA: hypothetical protein G4O08_02055 [Anaerolineae bacterium]|nr:hypothetical protein [Anaerolineae bacterium]